MAYRNTIEIFHVNTQIVLTLGYGELSLLNHDDEKNNTETSAKEDKSFSIIFDLISPKVWVDNN